MGLKEEVRKIVAKRRDFEFKINSKGFTKEDVLRYAEYELQLNQLRLLRKKKEGITIKLLSDHFMPDRIERLFRRATRKFSSESPKQKNVYFLFLFVSQSSFLYFGR